MGDILRPDWSGRARRVWRISSLPPVSALVVSAPANIKYLSGFDGSSGLLVLTPDESHLLLDGRYERAAREAAESGAMAAVAIHRVPARFEDALSDLLRRLPLGAVGFEAEQVTVATLEAWQRGTSGRTWLPTYRWVERLRAVKDGWEIAAIRRACEALSDVARDLRRWVAPGRTEVEVAQDINAAMRRAGLSRPAFETIVASGPNSAHPHARPTDRRLRDGDLVVLDFGGVLDGYCGDLTRMAGVGQVKAEARALFEAVRAAQGAALAAVRADALAFDVDAAARQVLTDHGLEDAILHATGHGLGLEVHEAPRLGRTSVDRADRLEAGMVCTIEPGAYVEGLGGVRLEDDVLVAADGCEVLTTAPRDLLVV